MKLLLPLCLLLSAGIYAQDQPQRPANASLELRNEPLNQNRRRIWEDRDGLRYYGYADGRGDTLIPPQFYGAKPFDKNGLAVVVQKEEKAYGLIDTNGKMVVPYIGGSMKYATENCIVTLAEGRLKQYDKRGKILLDRYPAFNYKIDPFTGVTEVKGETTEYFDTSGRFVSGESFVPDRTPMVDYSAWIGIYKPAPGEEIIGVYQGSITTNGISKKSDPYLIKKKGAYYFVFLARRSYPQRLAYRFAASDTDTLIGTPERLGTLNLNRPGISHTARLIFSGNSITLEHIISGDRYRQKTTIRATHLTYDAAIEKVSGVQSDYYLKYTPEDWGLQTEAGETVLPAKFAAIFALPEDWFMVSEERPRHYFLHRDGRRLPLLHDEADGPRVRLSKIGETRIINLIGISVPLYGKDSLLYPPSWYGQLRTFGSSDYVLSYDVWRKRTVMWDLKRRTSVRTIPFELSGMQMSGQPMYYKSGHQEFGPAGLYDRNINEIIPPRYKEIKQAYTGPTGKLMFQLTTAGDSIQLADSLGRFLFSSPAKQALYFTGGHCVAEINDERVHLSDYSGKRLGNLPYTSLKHVYKARANEYFEYSGSMYAIVSRNNKYGMLDSMGHEILQLQYDSIQAWTHGQDFAYAFPFTKGSARLLNLSTGEFSGKRYDLVLTYHDAQNYASDYSSLGQINQEIFAKKYTAILRRKKHFYFLSHDLEVTPLIALPEGTPQELLDYIGWRK